MVGHDSEGQHPDPEEALAHSHQRDKPLPLVVVEREPPVHPPGRCSGRISPIPGTFKQAVIMVALPCPDTPCRSTFFSQRVRPFVFGAACLTNPYSPNHITRFSGYT